MLAKIKKRTADDSGNMSIETVLWFPVYILIIGVVFDSTMLMLGQTQMWTIASDASRFVALGQMTETEAEAFVANQAPEGVELVVDVTSDGARVTTQINRKFSNVRGIGILTTGDMQLDVRSSYRIEPSV